MSTARQILKRLYEGGDTGLADHELAVLCPDICISTVRGTRKDLERNDLCIKTGGSKQTVTGCYGAIYRITEKGRQHIESGRNLPPKQLPETDDSILRQIMVKVRQGYDFQCGSLKAENKFYAGFFNEKSVICRECDSPLLLQEVLGVGITPKDAIIRALNL